MNVGYQQALGTGAVCNLLSFLSHLSMNLNLKSITEGLRVRFEDIISNLKQMPLNHSSRISGSTLIAVIILSEQVFFFSNGKRCNSLVKFDFNKEIKHHFYFPVPWICSLHWHFIHVSEEDIKENGEPGTAELHISVLCGIKHDTIKWATLQNDECCSCCSIYLSL